MVMLNSHLRKFTEEERSQVREDLEIYILKERLMTVEYAQHEEGSREYLVGLVEGRHPGTIQIVKYFAWSHLPVRLIPFSREVGLLALYMVKTLPDGPELTTGLRKLLEAKDCFVRAALDVD